MKLMGDKVRDLALDLVRQIAAQWGDVDHDSARDPSHSGERYLRVTFDLDTPAQATCEFCGEPCPEDQYHPTWHDEGSPMRSCDECLPDTPAQASDDRAPAEDWEVGDGLPYWVRAHAEAEASLAALIEKALAVVVWAHYDFQQCPVCGEEVCDPDCRMLALHDEIAKAVG